MTGSDCMTPKLPCQPWWSKLPCGPELGIEEARARPLGDRQSAATNIERPPAFERLERVPPSGTRLSACRASSIRNPEYRLCRIFTCRPRACPNAIAIVLSHTVAVTVRPYVAARLPSIDLAANRLGR